MDVNDTSPKRLKETDCLKYLAAGSNITDEAYKKVVDGSFGLLVERPCSVEIKDFKEGTASDIYSSLISYIVNVIATRETNESVRSHFEQLNFPASRINYFVSVLEEKREEVESIFGSQHPSLPSITDCTWRFDQNLSTFVPPRKPRPRYYILVKTNEGGYLRFSCNPNQMQNLHNKVKEIVNHVEKLSLS